MTLRDASVMDRLEEIRFGGKQKRNFAVAGEPMTWEEMGKEIEDARNELAAGELLVMKL